jgi:hypothetical protein
MRSESTSIDSTRSDLRSVTGLMYNSSKPNETRIDEYRLDKSRGLQTIIGFIDNYITYKGIYIARSPLTLLVP